MFNLHDNHRNLVSTSLLIFVFLSIMIAVYPAYDLQDTEPLPTMSDLTPLEREGLEVYVAENCMACHTQQVRNIEMDQVWGKRPSIPSDYYYSKQRMDFWRQSPSLLGSERTGPDLTDIGNRQPSDDWHLMHLFNPRVVVSESVMPSYPWLFSEKSEGQITENDVVVAVPAERLSNPSNKLVASHKALALVSYLKTLKQAPLQGVETPEFIAKRGTKKTTGAGGVQQEAEAAISEGEQLYMQTCAACHQASGKGLKGAFPSLIGSEIVNDENPQTLIEIILLGYDARPEYSTMPGFASQLNDAEIAAIANHERTSWGNDAPPLTEEQVKEIRESILSLNP